MSQNTLLGERLIVYHKFMPTGIYKRNNKHIEILLKNISKAILQAAKVNKGKHLTKEHRIKISQANKGKVSPMLGKTAWNKGLKMSEEFKKKCSIANKGKKCTEETKIKMSKSHLGKNTWMKGRKLSLETKEKIIKSMLGEKNHQWKGGIVEKDKIERNRFRKILQKKVFERDDYTCQICEQVGGDLQVDHIQSWADYVELRFNIKNCRTLCSKCHYYITFNKPMPKEIKGWGHNFLRRDHL